MTFILFAIVLTGMFLGARRVEDNAAATRHLVEQNRALTLRLDAQTDAQQEALCASRVEARNDLKMLLLGMVDDFIPVGRPARFELERRINDALGSAPEDCKDVPGA
jgi:hypothetical protein